MVDFFQNFLATQGQMAANDAQAINNKLGLQKLAQQDEAAKMQKATLAAYAEKPPVTTLANLSDNAEAPMSAYAESPLKTAGAEQRVEKKATSAANALMAAAEEAGELAKRLQSVNPGEADRQRRERDKLLTQAAPLLKEERQAQIQEANDVRQWAASVSDEPSYQVVMGQIAKQHPEWLQMKLPNGQPMFDRNLDGSFAYTPKAQSVIKALGDQSLTRIQKLQMEDKVADNKRADLELELKKKQAAEQERRNKATEALAREKREASANPKQPKAPIGFRYLEDGSLEPIPGGPKDPTNKTVGTKDVQQLSKALEAAKLPVASKVLGSAEALIKEDESLLEYATGPKSVLPDATIPEKARYLRQSIDKVFNIELKDRSGAAVTIPELQRLKDEYGRGAFKTPAQLKNAITQARELITDHYRSIGAGFGPDVLKAYNENLTSLGGTPVIDLSVKATQKTPSGPTTIKSDADYAALPSGAEYIAPDGSKRRKK